MKLNKKSGFVLTLTGILFLSSTITAFASGDWSDGRSYSWSPYVTDTSVTSYTDSLRARIDFFFDEDGADENNSIYYFTMEENCGDGKALMLDVQYSNIPDPHFDYDDDDGDGYDEESEVVEGVGATLNSSTSYYFTTWWDQDGSSYIPSGDLYFIAQNSIYNPFNGEYEAYKYDLLDTVSYSSISSVAGNLVEEYKESNENTQIPEEYKEEKITVENETTYTKQLKENGGKMEITISPNAKSKDDLKAYKEMQVNAINEIRDGRIMNSSDSLLSQGTVTFAEPISIETFNDILKESDASLKDCEIKLINEKGEWITANVTNLDELDTSELVKEISAETGEEELKYIGITSARVLLDLSTSSYDTISKDENVYFVDMMDAIIKNEYQDYDGDLKVRVFDLSWCIEK